MSEGELLQTYGRYAFLAIDEVDIINQTSWAEVTLRTLLDTRYSRRQSVATAIATNKPPADLWPYMASRWEEGIRIPMRGESLRKQDKELFFWQKE